MSDRTGNQVIIRVDQRLFYGIVAFFGIIALFGVGLYVGRLTSGASRAAAPVAPVAQSQSPLALPQNQPQAGAQAVPPVTSKDTAGANPFQQQQPSAVQAPANVVPFGTDPRVIIPEIKDKAYTFDFGEVKPDQKVEKVLQLKNDGKSDLIIDNVSASCGCTAAVVSDDKVAAGQATDLRIGYDPRVNKDAGKFITRKVQVKFHFADAPNDIKTQDFTITANVSN